MLDLIAAVFCGLIALTLFALHAITSPAHQRWFTMPAHLRIGLLLTGFFFMLRSVNLVTLAPDPEVVRGHVNFEGFIASGLLLYLLVSTTLWVRSLMLDKARDSFVLMDDGQMMTLVGETKTYRLGDGRRVAAPRKKRRPF